MGNKLTSCLIGGRVPESALVLSDPFFFDEGLGHSFCYVRPDPLRLSSSKVHHHEELLCASNPNNSTASMFRTISGASVSANTSTTPLPSSATTPSAMLLAASYSADCYASSSPAPAAAFDCSDSFCSVPLQPVPRPGSSSLSAPIQPSTPQDRGFLSGPIERGFMSGPIDPRAAANTGTGAFSGPIQNTSSTTVAADPSFLRRSFSLTGGRPPRNPSFRPARNRRKGSLIRALKRAVARTVSFGGSGNQQNSVVAPITKAVSSAAAAAREAEATSSGDRSFSEDVQWAQGKAGEDRVHVVISEEHGWVFVGIYDGFNGPDAPDYLLANLYPAVHAELRGLLWQEHEEEEDEEEEGDSEESAGTASSSSPSPLSQEPPSARRKWGGRGGENRGRWKCEWDHHHNCSLSKSSPLEPDHAAVLKALSRALRKTEDTYLGIADEVVAENPELALMGSCVLVMLMKGEDVYVMNVGDSRAVLAREPEKQHHRRTEVVTRGAATKGWRYEEPTEGDVEAVQLTLDHSTGVDEEVQRLRKEHPDDAYVLLNDRVKGSLKLTRAFGAGFLKQPKWNNALLEMFRIDYVGTSPYITCTPSVRHHRLGLKDKFLILSSDGLYQYLTNEEAVNQVESFFTNFPEGDPAQHLVEEVLFRAAKKAGMDFHELLEIPQGDRRQYHDDISVIVISLEGRIWRSGV